MLEDKWLVQIFAEDQDGDSCIGTGYSIGNNLVLTARHVVFFNNRANNPDLRMVWPGQNGHEISFSDEDIVFQGQDKIDVALIRCPEELPFTPPVVSLATKNPDVHEQWKSRGYLRAGKAGLTREDKGVPGSIAGIGEDNSILELLSDLDVTEETGWGGMSGAPVFLGDKLVGVITVRYTTIKKYLHAVSIPYLLEEESFREAVGLTEEATVRLIEEKRRERVRRQLEEILRKGRIPTQRLAEKLGLFSGAGPVDLADHLVSRNGSGDAISLLADITSRQEQQLAKRSPDRWDEYLYDVERMCGWLLINSIDPHWWLDNEQRLQILLNRSVVEKFDLDAPGYFEVILSHSLNQRARYRLDEYGVIHPAGEQYDVRLFDGVSEEATDIQLLSPIYQDLRRAPNAPQDQDKLQEDIKQTARNLNRVREGRPIYYMVTSEFLNLLKGRAWFADFERDLAGYLLFVCVDGAPDSSEPGPCLEDQGDLLELMAIILRFRYKRRGFNEQYSPAR